MTPTSVGMRCPECSKDRTPVKTMRTLSTTALRATQGLIAINVVAFLASGSFSLAGGSGASNVVQHGALFGPAISMQHEYWRLLTGGFLHANLIHIAFNMYLLWVLGQILEPALGSARFLAVYFTALLAGSFGALLAVPDALTLGASGAVFGLMGAAIIEMRAQGVDPMQSGIPGLIVINLVLSFTISGISVGGHIGGLFGGALAALALQLGERRRSRAVGLVGCLALSSLAAASAIAVA